MIKKFSKLIAFVAVAVFVGVTVVYAGSLTPPGVPSATMYTLDDIYTKLINNTNAGSHTLSTSTSPTGTFHTLTQIYGAVPTIDPTKVLLGTPYLGVAGTYDASNLTAPNVKLGTTFGVSSTGTLVPSGGTATTSDVFSGLTFFGASQTDWNTKTGTLNLACNTSTFDGTDNKVADAYDGAGNGNNRWCMTDTGTASASDILLNKVAWVNGQAITGNIPSGINVSGAVGSKTFNIPDGYYSGSKTVTANDNNLTAANIASGVTIFGVPGSAIVALGNAGAGDVLTTKTFSNGTTANVPGTMPNNGAVTITPGTSNQTILAGYHNGSGVVSGDTHLLAANIASGVTIFGVPGSAIVSLGNAGAGDVLSGKTFSTSTATNVPGAIPVNSGTDTSSVTSATSTNKLLLTVPTGYYDGTATVSASSANFNSANIASGVDIFGVTGSLAAGFTYNAAPLKTGQTLCYATSTSGAGHACSGGTDTGQDGDSQRGVARSYTSTANTTTDLATGLVWQKQDDNVTRKWIDAIAYCNNNTAGLPTDGLPGTSWRLPTINELLSIVDYGKVSGATINLTYFPATQASNYWSATTYQNAGDESNAWLVLFYGGSTNYNNKTSSYRVRCVRG